MAWTPLPVGIEDFAELRQRYYFIDKTLFIKDLLDMKGKVNLFTRPRRFGKTLNMSMLRYFFEISATQDLFQGLKDHGCRKNISDPYGQISGNLAYAEINEAILI